MFGKLIPVLIATMGLGAGVGAGMYLRPHPAPELADVGTQPCGDVGAPPASAPVAVPTAEKGEFVKLNNQFVFPLVENGAVSALVVLTLSLEVAPGQTEAVHTREPKLRDGFLRVLLDHANAGGFEGSFTANQAMDRLRSALLEKGREELGEALFDVLILDINRQNT